MGKNVELISVCRYIEWRRKIERLWFLQNKNQWLENHSDYIMKFSISFAHSNFVLFFSSLFATFYCRRINEWIILRTMMRSEERNKRERKLQNLFGNKDNKEEKRDINYSWKQEQQIPIKNDCQMPSCFKCVSFLRFVIFFSFC